MKVTISKNGRITLPISVFYDRGFRRSDDLGADILYSQETDELAFDLYRQEPIRFSARPRAQINLGASLYFDRSGSLDAQAYLPRFNFWKYEPHLPPVERLRYDPQSTNWKTYIEKYALDYTHIDSFIIVKLNPKNPKTAIPSSFIKLNTVRIRKNEEVTLSKRGLLTLPKPQLAEIVKGAPLDPNERPSHILRTRRIRYSISFDPSSQTFQLSFGNSGTHLVRKDGTIEIDALLKHHRITFTSRLHLNYNLIENTLTFALTDESLDLLPIRRVKQSLGIIV